MEVHHHSHHGKKKWTEYFWEFFMLFLAVTLGFFVENQREHIVEGKREKEYIRSMIKDLKLDTAGFSFDNRIRSIAINMYDSAIILLNKENRTEAEQQRLYYLSRMGLRLSPFPTMHDKTFEQMKSSGNLRLIHNSEIADAITSYYFNSKEFSLNVEQTLLRLQSLLEIHGKVFNGAVFQEMITDKEQFLLSPPTGNPSLMTGDKKILNELSVSNHYVLSILNYSKGFIADLNKKAGELIGLLEKKYHLK